ncbi:hypothetical protein V6O07_04980 [Arthrospira platensis SPKY2]
MFTIEKNVPLVAVGNRRTSKYPYAQLDVGDSFFVPGTTTKSLGSAAANAAKKLGVVFATRTVTENGVTGVRIWRVE